MTRWRCTYLKKNGEACKRDAQPGRTTCKQHAAHGRTVEVLASRKHRGIAGWGTRQRADRRPTAIG
jgi:hypothetical protein